MRPAKRFDSCKCQHIIIEGGRHTMEMKWIKTFIVAAEYENFRQASERLFLAQPTVTVHIKQLEKHIGQALFERKGRHITLTSAGHRFLAHAKQMLLNYEQSMQDMENYRQGYNRQLSIAVSPLIASSILPSIIRRFVKKHPTIDVQVNVLDSKEIASAINNGTADVGLSRMPTVRNDLMCEKVYDDRVVFVAPHDGADYENSPPLDAELILEQNIILSHNHPDYWDSLLLLLKQTYDHLHLRTMVVSQVHITKRFIEEGLGISFLPYSSVKRELMEGRLLEVEFSRNEIQLPTASTYVIRKSYTEESNSFLRFIKDNL